MQLFHFWSRDVHPVQNLLLYTKFHENRVIFHWDMAIYRFSKWRPSAILGLFYHHTRPPTSLCCWPQLPVKFHVNLIHRSEDIAIWICRIFGLKCLFRPPKWGFWGLWTPKCDYSSSRPPKGTPVPYILISVCFTILFLYVHIVHAYVHIVHAYMHVFIWFLSAVNKQINN